ncbi:MAG: SDR family oxidoreductase [Dehalococcoidia bacterium]|nr:SDR family oxidoreductase [Dehalococcoidia bacterium]
MIYDFKGKVAIITGASQGIGLGCAEAFVRGGADVAICARTPANIESATQQLEALAQSSGSGSRVLGVVADLSTAEGVDGFVKQSAERFGGIDIMVNSAGGSRSAPFLELPDEYLTEAWNLKLLGGIRITRAVVPHMEKRPNGGAIILLTGGSSGHNPQRVPAWSTNGAQRSWVSAVAGDLAARNVTINLLMPGLVATRRYTIEIERRAKESGVSYEEALQKQVANVPTKHVTTPEEIAELVAFLCTRPVINLTGHEIYCAY